MRPDGFEDHLDALDALQVGHAGLGRRGRGRFLGLTGVGVKALARLGHHLRQDLLDTLMAGGATAAGLGVVGHLFHGLEAVGANGVFDHHRVHGKALADQGAFFVVVLHPLFTAVVGHRRLQCLAAHDRAMHFFRRQAVKVIGNILVGHLQCFVNRHALDDFSQCR